MAKKAYVGVSNVARKVKKMYVGVGGVARKVKKGYIGVNGVARLFYSFGTPGKYGTTTALNTTRSSGMGASVGNYVVLAGGYNNGTSINAVDAYDKTLTHYTPTQLSGPMVGAAAVSLPSYALFVPGMYNNSELNYDTTEAGANVYNTSLTRSTIQHITQMQGKSGANFPGGSAIVGGGASSSMQSSFRDAFAYSPTLTRTKITLLGTGGEYDAACNNIYIIFGGKRSSSGGGFSNVYAYNSAFTQSVPEALSYTSTYSAAARVGQYVIFTKWNPTFDCYNQSLTHSTFQNNLYNFTTYTGLSIDDYGFFAGYRAVICLDASLTVTALSLLTLSSATSYRINNFGGVVGNYALIVGGYYDSSYFNYVDVYGLL